MSGSHLFERYEVIRRLAVGGMGELFLARRVAPTGLNRLVILKTLLPDFAEQESYLTQFLDEAMLLASLSHANVVHIHEVGECEGTHFIAMEYVHGVDVERLGRLCRHRGLPVPPRIAAWIGMSAARGLDHAHRARDAQGRVLRLVHRDVTPGNIMVRLDGVVKVVDFGVARANHRLTRTAGSLVKGTPRYMSPEQVTGGTLDCRSDEFSLGIVLYELLANAAAFGDDGMDAMAAQIAMLELPPLVEKEPSCPRALSDIVQRMLSRHAADRYPSCGEAAEALAGFIDDTGGQVLAEVAAFVRLVAGDIVERRVRDLRPELLPMREPRERGRVICCICGHSQRASNRFCPECGSRLKSSFGVEAASTITSPPRRAPFAPPVAERLQAELDGFLREETEAPRSKARAT